MDSKKVTSEQTLQKHDLFEAFAGDDNSYPDG